MLRIGQKIRIKNTTIAPALNLLQDSAERHELIGKCDYIAGIREVNGIPYYWLDINDGAWDEKWLEIVEE